jgi:membrane associated rhomboid family serine protease
VIPLKDNIPTDRFPLVTVALIVANIVVYLLTIGHGGSIIGGPSAAEEIKYGAVPNAISAWTAFTSMFVHASIIQLAVNMLFLWIFGATIEDAMGPLRYVLFYLVGGVAALALTVALAPHSTAPIVGAAGAIAALAGGYLVLYRGARFYAISLIPLYLTVVEVPAVAMIAIWFGVQALFAAVGLTDPVGGGGFAVYFAQLGGFVFGMLTIGLLAKNGKPVPPAGNVAPP